VIIFIGRIDPAGVLADQLVWRIAEHACGSRVDQKDPAIFVADIDALRSIADYGLKQRVLPQFLVSA
jgi:hypothetical protein